MGASRHRGVVDPDIALGRILKDLQRQGILPKDATTDQLKAMARRAVKEAQRARKRLSRLATGSKTGKQAVDDRIYLLDMLRGAAQGKPTLASIFVHRIKDRTFRLREGVWTDSRFNPKTTGKKKLQVKAFSKDYFAVLRQHPELQPFLAFSTRILVVLDDLVVEVK